MKVIYEAADGTKFLSKEECEKYEKSTIKQKMYLVPIDVACCLDWHILASSKDEAIDIANHMLRTVTDEYILDGCVIGGTTIIDCDIMEEEDK